MVDCATGEGTSYLSQFAFLEKKVCGRFSECRICLMVHGLFFSLFFFPFGHFLFERRKSFREKAPGEPRFHFSLDSCRSWGPATLPYIGLFFSTGYGQCLCTEAPSFHYPERKFPEQAVFCYLLLVIATATVPVVVLLLLRLLLSG